jgi:hypothetical protein
VASNLAAFLFNAPCGNIVFRDAVDLYDFIGSWPCIKGWIEGPKKGKEKRKKAWQEPDCGWWCPLNQVTHFHFIIFQLSIEIMRCHVLVTKEDRVKEMWTQLSWTRKKMRL